MTQLCVAISITEATVSYTYLTKFSKRPKGDEGKQLPPGLNSKFWLLVKPTVKGDSPWTPVDIIGCQVVQWVSVQTLHTTSEAMVSPIVYNMTFLTYLKFKVACTLRMSETTSRRSHPSLTWYEFNPTDNSSR